MSITLVRLFGFGMIATASLMASAPTAHAQDFFANLFGGFGNQQRMSPMPFASEYEQPRVQRSYAPRVSVGGGAQAYCVRTCDGRYFPISASDSQSRAASCNNFCPASETKVFTGSAIDNATSDTGKSYSSMPNAFKYRNELVAGCTCNGKDQIGLAPVKIENDPTLKRGDIVAGAEGLMVSRGSDRRGASLIMTPASQSVRAKYERMPVVAQE